MVEFPVCGDALKHDSLVCLQSEQMMIEGVEHAVMSVFLGYRWSQSLLSWFSSKTFFTS